MKESLLYDCVKSKDLDLADSFSRDFLIFLTAQVFVLFLSLLFCFLLSRIQNM